MYSKSCSIFSRIALACILATSLLFTGIAFAQSTATIQGSVVDATGAGVPNATVTVRNQGTGEERTTSTDAAGTYVLASLPVGTYRVEAKASGMQTTVASDLLLEVGSTVRQDFNLKISATSETIEIKATAPVINSDPVSVGTVIGQKT